MPEKIKITRTLYVGLGGTGVRSILRTKQCFVDAYGEVPPMVAFLAIDTDKGIRDKFLTSSKGIRVSLSDNEICFCGINGSAIDIYHRHVPDYQWLPKRNIKFLTNLRGNGAKQIRSNGRFLARYNARPISRLVENKVAEISAPVPDDSQFTYDTNTTGAEYPTKINIVGSVAGGTGSGTFIDILVLIAETLRRSSFDYSITPWLVLPDVFRVMMPGPPSENVYQNAYGALKELDYLFHLDIDNENILDFNFAKIRHIDEKISFAYLFNNTNKSGIVFQHIDDIADSVGRCMYLPANEIGKDALSIEDNIEGAKESTSFDIENKLGRYVSSGSAEIVYDNQAVGNVIARGIIAKICNELGQSNSTDVLKEVNAWMASADVAIQEHEADQLTDSILNKYAPFGVTIDKESDINTINAYISSGADAKHVEDEARRNELNKLENVKQQLLIKYEQILNTQNGVGECKAFLESLLDNISICKDEMFDEVSILQAALAYDMNWESDLSGLRTGLFNLFSKDGAEVLQGKVNDYIAQKRDLLRHNLAIQFYTDFTEYTKELLDKISVFKIKLEEVERKQRKDITSIQRHADSTSYFQIYLHSNEVNKIVLPNIKDTSALLRSETPIYDLVDRSIEDLDNIFFNFAKKQSVVLDAVNVSVEQKLGKMSKKELEAIFTRVKEMSSPLWSTNTAGYADKIQELCTIFAIGVNDQSTCPIKEGLKREFTSGTIKPLLASTKQTDRISFLQIQYLSPVYAVNNLRSYMREAEEKLKSDNKPVYYLDESWYQRMHIEGFDIMPKEATDTVLPNWVNAIVYGFITYDETNKTYCIESEQGDILDGGMLNLGERRDLAFEQFQLRGLDKEVEKRIQEMIFAQGRPAVEAIIKDAKRGIKNYVSQIAKLSPIELDRIQAKDASYKMVRDQLEKEVTYLNKLDL